MIYWKGKMIHVICAEEFHILESMLVQYPELREAIVNKMSQNIVDNRKSSRMTKLMNAAEVYMSGLSIRGTVKNTGIRKSMLITHLKGSKVMRGKHEHFYT